MTPDDERAARVAALRVIIGGMGVRAVASWLEMEAEAWSENNAHLESDTASGRVQGVLMLRAALEERVYRLHFGECDLCGRAPQDEGHAFDCARARRADERERAALVVTLDLNCPHCLAVDDAIRVETMPSGVDNLHCNACGRDSPLGPRAKATVV